MHFFLSNKYFTTSLEELGSFTVQRQHRAKTQVTFSGDREKDGWTAAIEQERKEKMYLEKGERKGIEQCGKE